MLAVGQKYHKGGVVYQVKAFLIKTFKLKLTLVNVETKEVSHIDTTITNFTSTYSKLPDSGVELVE